MEESTLIKTLDVFIEQIGNLQKNIDFFNDYLKHEALHKVNNDIIYGKIFGYDFKIQNFEWLPNCTMGHICIKQKDKIRFYDIWFDMWKEKEFDKFSNKEKEIAIELKTITKSFFTNEEKLNIFLENMNKDGFNDEIYDCEYYNIETHYEKINEFCIDKYALSKINSKKIQQIHIDYDEIRIFYDTCDNKDNSIIKMIEFLFENLKFLNLKKEDVELIHFTHMKYYTYHIMKYYDFHTINLSKINDIIINFINNKCKCSIEEELQEFKKKSDKSIAPFYENLLLNDDSEWSWLMQILD